MGLNNSLLLLALALFGLLFWAVHREDRRGRDRRKQALPHPVERRVRDRRSGRVGTALRWVVRTLLKRA